MPFRAPGVSVAYQIRCVGSRIQRLITGPLCARGRGYFGAGLPRALPRCDRSTWQTCCTLSYASHSDDEGRCKRPTVHAKLLWTTHDPRMRPEQMEGQCCLSNIISFVPSTPTAIAVTAARI